MAPPQVRAVMVTCVGDLCVAFTKTGRDRDACATVESGELAVSTSATSPVWKGGPACSCAHDEEAFDGVPWFEGVVVALAAQSAPAPRRQGGGLGRARRLAAHRPRGSVRRPGDEPVRRGHPRP